jgi:SDR family mycofactocin-dependent oxidoreductase
VTAQPLAGQVAFVTGAARGQGRSHALRLAQAGADIIAIDMCRDMDSVPYPLATPDDLTETVAMIEALGRGIWAAHADVRDLDGLQRAFDEGRERMGSATIVVANAGIAPMTVEPRPTQWQDVLDVNLTGVYHTIEVALPSMLADGRPGSIILINSTAGLNGIGGPGPGSMGYTAAKHGCVGLMRAYANQLATAGIRVNSIHPTGVNTPMVVNAPMMEYFDSEVGRSNATKNAMPVGMIEAIDVSNAVLWLATEDARYVTGVALPVDAGYTNRK